MENDRACASEWEMHGWHVGKPKGDIPQLPVPIHKSVKTETTFCFPKHCAVKACHKVPMMKPTSMNGADSCTGRACGQDWSVASESAPELQ